MDVVREIKDRLSIEDVAGEYLTLKRAGRNFKAHSPFTNEKTPSFIVSPEKQIWHDFSAGKGGDIFSLIIELEGVDFKGALELLARKSGVDIEQFKGASRKGPNKERLYDALELAAKFYQVQLKNKQEALEYIFNKRGFDKQTVLLFQLGYSPDASDGLTRFLLKKKFSEEEIKLAGLAVNRYGRVYDMFRGRIMVPLHDQFGKVIGFTARLLIDNDNAPKYINTPQTPLYDKSRHVYGLHLAKKSIKEKNYSVIAEGNLDVITSHQAGINNVVATAGTAITEMQLKSLHRLSDDIRLAFDQDRAGLAAAERAIPIASRVGANLGIITIPSGKDPDELIRQDKALWVSAIAGSQYALDWLIDRYKAKIDLASARGKREFTDVLAAVLRGVTDQVEKDHYIHEIAEITGVSTEAVKDKMTHASSKPKPKKQIKQIEKASEITIDIDWQKAVDRLLALGLMLPSTRSYLALMETEMFASSHSMQVFEFLRDNPQFDGAPDKAQELKGMGDYVKILSLQFEELYGTVDMLELQYEAARLRAKVIQNFVKQQKTLLSVRIKENPNDRTLLEKSRDLDQLLNKAKE